MAIIAAATTATTTATKMGSRRERGDRQHQQQQQVEEDQDVRQATEEGLHQQQQQRPDNGKAAAVDDGHGQDVVMPGFRFHPTEEELVEFYLRRKVEGKRFNVELITFLDLYRYDPWELPALAAIGEKEWFFYVPRDRKYRNGDRPNRVTTSGYWKATGADRMIRNENNSRPIGLKKTLVFYSGKAPKGVRTSWIMNEYRLPQTAYDSMDVPSQKAEISLCRVYKRPGVEDHHQHSSSHRPASMSSRTSSASKKQDAYSPAQHQIPTSFHGLPPSDSPVSASPEAFIVERMHQESIGAGTSDSTNMADVMVAAAHAAAYAPDPMSTATAVVTGPASDLQLVGDHTLRRLQRHDPGRLLLSSTSATRSVPTCSTTTFGAPAGYGGIPIPPPGTISSINNQTCSTSASTSVDNPLAAIDELSRFMEYHHQAQQQNQNHHHHHHNYYQQSAYLLQQPQPQPQPHQNQQLLPSHQPITHPPAMLPFTSSMAAALTAFPEKLWEWNLIPDAGSASAARDYSTAYK